MSHDARAVANELISMGLADGNPLTPMQVIKLTYLCQAWMLGIFGESMFEQKVEAWEYGPVIADVYHGVKHFVNQPVNETMRARPANFSDPQVHILNEVYQVYGKRSGGALSWRTHQKGTPWNQVRQENPGKINAEIDHDRLKRYYESILQDSGGEVGAFSVIGL